MTRRRNTPWIQRWSRPIIATLAGLGVLDTAYLTLVELGVFKEAVCPTAGPIDCQAVLESAYAKLFGIPLSLFGMLAYLGIMVCALVPLFLKGPERKSASNPIEHWTWLLIFAGSTAMVVFSGYLVYLMSVEIGAFCIYCLASAIFSVSLLVVTVLGRDWEDIGQLFFTGIVVGMVALIGTVGIYASTEKPLAQQPGVVAADPNLVQSPVGDPVPGKGWPITTTSGAAEIALAKHLKQVGAKEYGAYWCPHCHEQKLLFGQEAAKDLLYVECADNPAQPRQQSQACQAAGITSYPTWEINGQKLPGVQTLNKLAELTGYTGPKNFKNAFAQNP